MAAAEPAPARMVWLDGVHEEWVAYPDKRKIVPYREHVEMAYKAGWWPSGWRGMDPDMKPLPPEVAEYFTRDHR